MNKREFNAKHIPTQAELNRLKELEQIEYKTNNEISEMVSLKLKYDNNYRKMLYDDNKEVDKYKAWTYSLVLALLLLYSMYNAQLNVSKRIASDIRGVISYMRNSNTEDADELSASIDERLSEILYGYGFDD